MIDLLFIYGTLSDHDNEFAIYLKNNSSFYCDARVRGRLYDLGEYPGAILSTDSDEFIYGQILKLNDPEKILPVIDDYEGYGEEQEQPNLFVRVMTEVLTENEMINCWVYAYNLPVEGHRHIGSGKYIK